MRRHSTLQGSSIPPHLNHRSCPTSSTPASQSICQRISTTWPELSYTSGGKSLSTSRRWWKVKKKIELRESPSVAASASVMNFSLAISHGMLLSSTYPRTGFSQAEVLQTCFPGHIRFCFSSPLFSIRRTISGAAHRGERNSLAPTYRTTRRIQMVSYKARLDASWGHSSCWSDISQEFVGNFLDRLGFSHSSRTYYER